MPTRAARRLAWTLALAAVPATLGFAGGWAIVTVEDVPERAVAGQPMTLTWTVRQHGMHKVDGLKGRIEASAGLLARNVRVDAVPGKAKGEYTATLTLPEPGDWRITVDGGFGKQHAAIVEVRAVQAGGATYAGIPEAERGRRLFQAKGCVTCHVQIKAGPNLDGRRYDPARLAAFLAKPDRAFSNWTGQPEMPNLELKPAEISALVAWINSDRQAKSH